MLKEIIRAEPSQNTAWKPAGWALPKLIRSVKPS